MIAGNEGLDVDEKADLLAEMEREQLTHARPGANGFDCGLSLYALAHVALYADEVTCPACWAAEKARAAS